MTEIKDPEVHRLVEEVGRNVETYAKSCSQIVEWRREREKLVRETLEPVAASLQRAFDALIIAAGKAGNGEVEGTLGYKGRQQMMLTRVAVSKQLDKKCQRLGRAHPRRRLSISRRRHRHSIPLRKVTGVP